jgi:NADH-quinone oxidoreductase subunit G/NADP-reducing hydrogenase subunit HndD
VTGGVAVAHGLANARKLLEKIASGEASYHFVEIMCCPGGCVGGGGQPRLTSDAMRAARASALYREDEAKTLRHSHENPHVLALYQKLLGEPNSKRAHELLHTKYQDRTAEIFGCE